MEEMTSHNLFREGDRDLLSSSFEKVRASLSYLQADISPNAICGQEFIKCSSFLNDGDLLSKVIRQSGRLINAPDEQTAVSLFVISYSYRILALGICTLFLAGVMPDSSPDNISFAISTGRVSKLCYLSSKYYPRSGDLHCDLKTVMDNIIEDHFTILTERIKVSFSIGKRLLWGNISSSAANVFRTLEGILGEEIIPAGQLFFELAPAEMKNQGNFYLLYHGEKRGWYWERKNCCLYYKLSGKAKCNDCSLLSAETRRANYQNQLSGE